MLILAWFLLIAALGLNLFEIIKQKKTKIGTRLNCCSARLSMIAVSTILQLLGIVRMLGSLTIIELALFSATFVYMVISIAAWDAIVHLKISENNERVG